MLQSVLKWRANWGWKRGVMKGAGLSTLWEGKGVDPTCEPEEDTPRGETTDTYVYKGPHILWSNFFQAGVNCKCQR